MAKLSFTCPADRHVIAVDTEDELLQEIKKHMNKVHGQEISEEEAKEMARSAQRVG